MLFGSENENLAVKVADKPEEAKAVKTAEEAIKLIKAGFEVPMEIDGFKLFRKRK